MFLLAQEEELKDAKELKEDLEDLEFQMFRMRENVKEIAKKSKVIGIEPTKGAEWVIVYLHDDGYQCKVMLTSCDSAFDGTWDFSIMASYKDEDHLHIGDIKGPENQGYGSICMKYLKEIAYEQNIRYVTGDIVKRDWDHLDRLIHFYEKHHFDVNIDTEKQAGDIVWQPA
ncbi:hypothetical protein P4631_01445 [Halalkalibacterium halodurans]|uniref:hypothetical protein n=1 Tax=Halalkalibacterium halodurans TaxID=86665 RepID=UPI002E1B4908|nr:hypothetical protein [Halalkalibacterium halodurans]MED4171111.1 hypothetical protein [Halalkalibacterium halodurans]